MFGPFEVTVAPDVVVSTKEKGVLTIQFNHPLSFFTMVEDLSEVETLVLKALGYGSEPPPQQSAKGSQDDNTR